MSGTIRQLKFEEEILLYQIDHLENDSLQHFQALQIINTKLFNSKLNEIKLKEELRKEKVNVQKIVATFPGKDGNIKLKESSRQTLSAKDVKERTDKRREINKSDNRIELLKLEIQEIQETVKDLIKLKVTIDLKIRTGIKQCDELFEKAENITNEISRLENEQKPVHDRVHTSERS